MMSTRHARLTAETTALLCLLRPSLEVCSASSGRWISGQRSKPARCEPSSASDATRTRRQAVKNATEQFYPSVGIYNRCIRLDNRKHCAPFSVQGMSTPDNLFPSYWKWTLVFLSIGLCLVSFTVGTSVLGFCVQSICRKSIFTISGALHSTAGIFYILGLVIYPFGWGSDRVQRLCGRDSSAFYIDGCTLGWAFYSCVIGIALTFLCAILSIQAEVATSSDKVQYQIHKGRTLICTP